MKSANIMSFFFQKKTGLSCIFAILLTIAWVNTSTFAQQVSPFDINFQRKLVSLSEKFGNNSLYIHTDKTLYTNNETVWFSAYLFGDLTVNKISHNLLYISLIRDIDKKLVLQEKFILKDGLGSGQLLLPDSIAPGQYRLTANTNILNGANIPVASFTKVISIKSINNGGLKASYTLIDSNKQSFKFSIKTAFSEGLPAKGAQIALSLYGRDKYLKTVTNSDGIAEFSIPKKDLLIKNSMFIVKHQNDIRFLPIATTPTKIQYRPQFKFYPEGGNLTNNVVNVLAWEATYNGSPIRVKAVLYKNNVTIDTVETSQYGIGKFVFLVEPSSTYNIKIFKNQLLQSDTIVKLPLGLDKNVNVHLRNAIADDSLRIQLHSNFDQKIKLLIHNYSNLYSSADLTINAHKLQFIKVALDSIPKGLCLITILDAQNRPLSERIFFAHHNLRNQLSIIADKSTLKRKQRVSINLDLKNNLGRPQKGIVSIACVQANRLESKNLVDIESYMYFGNNLGKMPLSFTDDIYNDKGYLEDVLLIKGWRKYNWRDLEKKDLIDTTGKFVSDDVEGNITYNGKELKKSQTITVLADSTVSIVKSNDNGGFSLSTDDLKVKYAKKALMTLSAKNKEGYRITINKPKVNPLILLSDAEKENNYIPQINSADSLTLDDRQGTRQLQEVVIKAKKDNSIFGADRMPFRENPCGDYVAVCNGLNCPLSGHNYKRFPPVKGKSYIIHTILNNRIISNRPYVYQGCTVIDQAKVFPTGGVYESIEFYGATEGPSNGMENLSTVYWNPKLIIPETGKANFTFVTGDISGKFQIIVEGVGQSDVIYKKSDLEIEK